MGNSNSVIVLYKFISTVRKSNKLSSSDVTLSSRIHISQRKKYLLVTKQSSVKCLEHIVARSLLKELSDLLMIEMSCCLHNSSLRHFGSR